MELKALSRDDLRRILTEPEANLIRQHQALLATENVTLTFTDDAIDALADAAVAVNGAVENIGARRLQTVLEKVVEEISFTASDRAGETLVIDGDYVRDRVGRTGQERRPVAGTFCSAGLLPPLHGEGQTAQRSGWGSAVRCADPTDARWRASTRPPLARPPSP